MMVDQVVYSSMERESRLINLLNKELRHIQNSHFTKLSSIIDASKDWDKLLEELSRPTSTTITPLHLSIDSISLIRGQSNHGSSPTLALLNYWSISGRRRPTLRSLLVLLHSCNLKRAEEYLCREILKIESVDALLPPAQRKSIKPPEHRVGEEFKFENLDALIRDLHIGVPKYSFSSIYESTNGFCHEPHDPLRLRGFKIGEGRFSSVFLARTYLESDETHDRKIVAAKLLKSECNRKYLINEINLMSRVKDENILKLLGIALGTSKSSDGHYLCLIYNYILNGSLFDCLSQGIKSHDGRFLSCEQRLVISIKIAEGISYLHRFPEGPIIHRDIKTANIFVDENLNPKIGDFTLVRLVEVNNTSDTQYSQNIIGTSVYMPPEAFRGDISIKFDTFSFGIVLLELLTGLKPFNSDLDQDLFTFINEELADIDDETSQPIGGQGSLGPNLERDNFLKTILDTKAGVWDFSKARDLFGIALWATESRKKNRPEVTDLLPRLKSMEPDQPLN